MDRIYFHTQKSMINIHNHIDPPIYWLDLLRGDWSDIIKGSSLEREGESETNKSIKKSAYR